MRAIAVSEYRAAAQLGEHDKPTAGPGQLLVKIQAAGMNPLDQSIASGAFSEVFPGVFPMILGVDVAGAVEAVGDDGGPYSVGQRVFGQLLAPPLGANGAYAEYAAVAADAPLATVPDALSSDIAAALPTPGVTALQLSRSLEPSAGKTVAVIGAGGAVGGFLTQLLVIGGARVLAVTMPRQTERVGSYGAHEVIDATADPTARIRGLAPDGVDALVDLVNDGEQFTLSASTVREGGVAVSTRYAADVDALAQQSIQAVNFVVGVTSADLQIVAHLAVSGQLLPPPLRTVALEAVPDLLNAGGDGFDGKTLVRPEQP